MTSDRKILTELLQLYREFSCLWDSRQVLYSNKEARTKAYEVLLEKYKQLYEDASIVDVKKKIDNMRSGYRRERSKVLSSRRNGDLEEYQPVLWYYDVLSFLDEILSPNIKFDDTVPQEKEVDTIKIEFDENPIKVKKRKSTIYLPEHDNDDDEGHNSMEDPMYNQDNENNSMYTQAPVTESEAFGTTIGLQLKDLEPMQRVIAEKLISDIIFKARLNKLNIDSSVNT